eukprot:TRINITY_DN90156_c0_g1_i1.p1 TRINITY_DN90156_c0_g1~~TRINITY_DN90156_c0_g1_i1.p1  ORF type:complete len:250 (+),score=38.01 TRINITY_DN90156_c0_g1_i1:40-750(+)
MLLRQHHFLLAHRTQLRRAVLGALCFAGVMQMAHELRPRPRSSRPMLSFATPPSSGGCCHASRSGLQAFCHPHMRSLLPCQAGSVCKQHWIVRHAQGDSLSDKEAKLKQYMTSDEVAAELLKAREAELAGYDPGYRPDAATVDGNMQKVAAVASLFGVILVVAAVFNIWNENYNTRDVVVSYSDICGSAAFQLKQMVFPWSECVEISDIRGPDPGEYKAANLPKTATEIMAEQGLR